jgi:protein-L-isoaspartate(D-aspartate) O-methyltransferase
MSLVDDLIKTGYLKTPRIIKAFRAVRRADFLSPMPDFGDREPLVAQELAELNQALPTAFGQTISQPSVVAFMIELLDPRPGHKVLDIGSGSGWTTALLANIVTHGKNGGKVVAIERIPELADFGRSNIFKY